VREFAGRHEYDGVVQDLSPAGVKAGLDARDAGWVETRPPDDAFDEQLMNQAGSGLRLVLDDPADHACGWSSRSQHRVWTRRHHAGLPPQKLA
jgi:hypothetical protein